MKFVVLDEADLLFEYGLALKTRKLLRMMPDKAQKLFFCVHLPKLLEEEAAKYLKKFERVKTYKGGTKLVAELDHQVKFVAEAGQKLDLLVKLLQQGKKTVVFCKTKDSA